MSKIGQRPIPLPPGVTVVREGQDVVVTGPKGTLRWQIPADITVETKESVVKVGRQEEEKRALHGLTRALVANMVKGVAEGYMKQLKIVGVGYRAEPTGTGLKFSLGFSHTIDFPASPGIALTTDKNVITVAGIDKQLVGETAARIRALKKPEPYKGKGIMYVDEKIRRKPGKAVKALGPGGGAGGA